MNERNTSFANTKRFCTGSFLFLAYLLTCSSPLSAQNLSSGAIYPKISDDGEQIVFSYQGAIWKMPRTGGTMTRLTDDQGFDVEPVWSPDGKWIAFLRGSDFASGRLKMISADGKSRQLPGRVISRDRLFFHPDGNRILGLFQNQQEGLNLRWYDIESGRFGPVLAPNIRRQRYALSQKGDRIALVLGRDKSVGEEGIPEQAGNNGPQFTIYIMPAEGGNSSSLVEFPARIYDLAWAENDQALIIVTNAGGAHNDLWRIPLDDPLRGARKMTFGQADEDRPTLSKDSRWMIYTDNHSGPSELRVWDLQNNKDQTPNVETRDFGVGTSQLHLTVLDAQSKQAVTARISVMREGGKYHSPPEKIYRIQGSNMHFYANGASSLTLPTGKYHITAWRGPEYGVTRQTVEVQPDRTSQVTLSLSRWTDQNSQGWYSGESHIHANYGYGHWYNSPRTMLAQSAGEDLLVSNLVVANSDSDGVYDREFFRGQADPLSTEATRLHWNEEFRSTIWGHLTLLNLQQLVEPIFTGFEHTTHPHDHPTNADVGMLVHDQDGHVNYTHPAQNLNDPYLTAYSAKALPIDIALGTVDSIDVMGSNQEANMRIWYGLLNCGFKIPASAGTDCFLNRIRSRLPGSVRFYVKLDGAYSYDAWMKGFKAGRTFATNGPMFEFTAGGKSLGETVELKAPSMISVTGEVRSQFPLSQAEFVFNGQVIETIKATGANSTRITIAQTISIPTSGWIALRARGERHPDAGSSLFGHTSPIYIEVKDRPNDASEDAQYFIDWIDRLWKDVQSRDRIPSRHFKHVKSQIENAREVYEQHGTAVTK